MNYKELLYKMMDESRGDAERYLSGDKTDYLYCKETDEEYGDTDKNYVNRTRLCYQLMYGGYQAEKIEDAVRELFVTEVVSRENESFQGVGVNLELLTCLLGRYQRPEDDALFERAKNANFDCELGYDKDHCMKRFKPLEELTLENCIWLADDLGRQDYACKFVDIIKEQPLGLEKLKQLELYAKHATKRMCDREQAVTGIYETYLAEPPKYEWDLCSAAEDYILMLADKGEGDRAAEVFMERLGLLKTHDRTYYSVGNRLITENVERKAEIWAAIRPAIKKMFNKMAPVEYDALAVTAESMGESKFAERLRKKGKQEREAIKRALGKE